MSEKIKVNYAWEPWNSFSKDAETLPILEPPCKWCKHFKPQRTYTETEVGQLYEGIQICWKDEMNHDFSCFVDDEIKFEEAQP